MERGKRVIGLIMIIISFFALFSWEKWGKEKFLYDEVLVLNENLQKGSIVSDEMLVSRKVECREKDALEKKDASWLKGKESVTFVHKGVPLFKEYFDEQELTSAGRDGQYTMSVPQEWVYKIPDSIVRGCKAFFYSDGHFVTSAFVSLADSEKESIEIIVNDEKAEALCRIAGRGQKMVLTYNQEER